MKQSSLKLRLLIFSALSIATVLGLIGFGLLWLLQNQLLTRVHSELGHQMNQLAALFSQDENGAVVVEGGMTDPRYERPLSGLYWQINQKGKAILRSRSLWDAELPDTNGPVPSLQSPVAVDGPGNSQLLVLSRIVWLQNVGGERKANGYRLAVAVDTIEMERNRNQLFRYLSLILVLSGLALTAGAWAQIRFGLKPLDNVRQNLELVLQGRRERLDEHKFPLEVQPLVLEINSLLEEQSSAIELARNRSADLAHGLKTPIAAIAAHIEGVDAIEKETIRSYLETMRRHIETELARARALGGKKRLSSKAKPALEAKNVVDILKKLPRGENLTWTIDVDPDICVAMDTEDLAEILGNLLDNARIWAKNRVVIKARSNGETVQITIEDDGVGIAEANLQNVVLRGIRLDEKIPGTGLGLSIVQAILDSYSAKLALKRSDLGGLLVSFRLSENKPFSSRRLP